MGWETLAIVGFQALSAQQGISAASKQAKAGIRVAEQNAMTTAENTLRTTGKLRTSFLQSGLTLEGGPMDVLKQAFGQGYTDIGRIKSNADTGSKNIVSAARTKALQGLASAAAGAAGASGGGSVFGDISNFGTDVGNGFTSLSNGTGFDLGYLASQSFRAAGGGFAPGEFQ
jgi:hypothetical protein